MIKVKGLDEIWLDKKGYLKSIEFELRKTMKKTIQVSKQTTLYNDITGLLRKSSIIRRIGKKDGGVVGTLMNRAFYSGYIHGGTHKITPRPFLANALEPELEGLRVKLGDATVRSIIHNRGRK
tara:strand:+ start:454 stop:822 length:369 start_codon:yes stop_codon:yes gene_type:complete